MPRHSWGEQKTERVAYADMDRYELCEGCKAARLAMVLKGYNFSIKGITVVWLPASTT